jgi:hypothetical protein
LKNPRWLRCCPALTWVGDAVMLAWYDIPSKCWIQTLTYDSIRFGFGQFPGEQINDATKLQPEGSGFKVWPVSFFLRLAVGFFEQFVESDTLLKKH